MTEEPQVNAFSGDGYPALFADTPKLGGDSVCKYGRSSTFVVSLFLVRGQ